MTEATNPNPEREDPVMITTNDLKKSTGRRARATLTSPARGAMRNRYRGRAGTLIEYRTFLFVPDDAPPATVFLVDEREVTINPA
jgi:hypothetical protein